MELTNMKKKKKLSKLEKLKGFSNYNVMIKIKLKFFDPNLKLK